MKRFLIAVLFVVVSSCSEKNTVVKLIDRETFEKIYIELLDSAQVTQAAPDSVLSPVAERILRRYEVTADQFRFTVREYNTDTSVWKEFYENILKKLEDRTRKNP